MMSSPKNLWRWFILAVVVSVKLLTCQGNRDNPVDIVVTDSGAENIVKLRVDGVDVIQTTLFSSINPVDIVYDDVENRLYWIEWSPDRIRSSDVDGRNVLLVTDLPFVNSYGLAVGLKVRKLFSTDWNRDVITSMDITGENLNTILNQTQVDDPLSITVHERKGIIIWNDEKTGYKISSSNFDGSDIKRIVDVTTKYVTGLAVDERSDVLYWSDRHTGRISSIFLDGTNRRVLYHHSNYLYNIVLLGNILYFTASDDRVHRMLINGSNVEEIQSTSEFTYPRGLVVLASETLDVTTPAPDVPARSSMIIALAIGLAGCLLLLGVLVGIFIFWRLKHRRLENTVPHVYDGLRYDAAYQSLIRVRGTPPQATDIPDVSDPYYLTPRPPQDMRVLQIIHTRHP